MKNTIGLFYLLIFLTLLTACNTRVTWIVFNEENTTQAELAAELGNYLSNTYGSEQFKLATSLNPGQRNIILNIDGGLNLVSEEGFRIVGGGDELVIEGRSERALQNGVYALLKKIGWRIYLSFEVPPANPSPLIFEEINIQDSPLKDTRIVFNWHNFISGCTGWNLVDWKKWIEQSRKIGFNTIMVHAYGNNPMQPLTMNGVDKPVGYLTTTKKGRDWGAQHVNDVRLIIGGELFEIDEFGSEAALVEEDNRSAAAVGLMQKVFDHAEKRSMNVCYAIDMDTWMANPQEILNTLPGESVIKIGDYIVANPDHPEGRKYYETQLNRLFDDYPQITHLAAWMRRPSRNISPHGTVWLRLTSDDMPETWKEEYFAKLDAASGFSDQIPIPGLFGISKIIELYREILDEIKPGTELILGSWGLDYTIMADLFMPDYCGLIPLDYSYVLDRPDKIEKLKKAGKNRMLLPIVWAHHDDHRYIGRPYKPFNNFNDLLDSANADGYGIIHWMTHPLDMLFENYERQVWNSTENISAQVTAEELSKAMMRREEVNLTRYYLSWFNEGPMFGRETSDYFISPLDPYNLEGYNSALEVVEKAEARLQLLSLVDESALSPAGLREFRYQKGMEKFIISFFNNYHRNHRAFMLLAEGKIDEAIKHFMEADPEQSIKHYADILRDYGATRGELGILVSLNLRWLPEFTDLRQRLGLDDIRINLQPTSHDPLAQGTGHYTFFIDQEGDIWKSIGDHEIRQNSESFTGESILKVEDSWVEFKNETTIPLGSIRNRPLVPGEYKIEIINPAEKFTGNLEIRLYEEDRLLYSSEIPDLNSNYSFNFITGGNTLNLKIIPDGNPVGVAGIRLKSLSKK